MKDPLRSQVSLRLGCQQFQSWKPGYLVLCIIRMRSQRLGGVSSVAVIINKNKTIRGCVFLGSPRLVRAREFI